MSKYILLLLVMMSSLQAKELLLTEKVLKDLYKSSPVFLSLELMKLRISEEKSQYEEKYQSSLGISYDHEKTNEETLIAFKPVMSPIENLKLQYDKTFKKGFKVKGALYSNKSSSDGILLSNGSPYSDGVTLGLAASFTLDLHKNFLGKLSDLTDRNLSLSKKRIALETKINSKVFYLKLRKLYWALVANNEALKISKKLLASSQKQLKDSKKRAADRVSDKGEVARYASQVSSRKASILKIKYNSEKFYKNLKDLLPTISKRDLVIGSYNIDEVLGDVLGCISHLDQLGDVPKMYTSFDEILNLVGLKYQNDKKLAESHDDFNAGFTYQIKSQSAEYGYADSISNYPDKAKLGHKVGFNISFALGDEKIKTTDIKLLIERKRFEKEKMELEGKLSAYHIQILKSIKLLNQVMVEVKRNSSQLSQSLNIVENKYNQARVSFREYISEQDLYQSSKLDEINTKLEIINTLLDYFSVFTETKCKINNF